MDYDMTNPYEIAKFIKDAKKATPVKVMVKGDLSGVSVPEGVKLFGTNDFWFLVGDNQLVQEVLSANAGKVQDTYTEYDRRNSAVPSRSSRERAVIPTIAAKSAPPRPRVV